MIFTKILASFIEVPGIFITLCIIMFFYYLKKEKKVRKFLLVMIIVLYIISCNWFARLAVYPLENAHPPLKLEGTLFEGNGLIVVLGGGIISNTPNDQQGEISDVAMQRLYNGYLLNRYLYYPIVVTGGKLPGTNDTPEAVKMSDVLEKLGTSNSMIYSELNARTTEENAIFTSDIIKKENIDKVYLVTSAVHMPRAYDVFKKYVNKELIPVPVGYLLSRNPLQWTDFFPSIGAVRAISMAWHEYVGLVFYKTK